LFFFLWGLFFCGGGVGGDGGLRSDRLFETDFYRR